MVGSIGGGLVTLRFTVLGYEVAKVTLDMEHDSHVSATSAVERGVKAVSRAWIKRMVTS